MANEITKFDNSSFQLACFYIGEVLCGFDIRYVQEIKKDKDLTKVPLAQDYILGIMNLRGQIVALIDLGKKLDLRPVVRSSQSRIIIVNWNNEFVGLLVDKISDVISLETVKIMPPPSNIKGVKGKYFRGVYHLENDLVSIVDIDLVLEER